MTPTDDDATPTNDRDANDNDYATINNHNNYKPPILRWPPCISFLFEFRRLLGRVGKVLVASLLPIVDFLYPHRNFHQACSATSAWVKGGVLWKQKKLQTPDPARRKYTFRTYKHRKSVFPAQIDRRKHKTGARPDHPETGGVQVHMRIGRLVGHK